MDATHTPPPDPIAIVQQLDAAALRERIDALDRERKALLVLLRAAQRMERGRVTPPQSQEGVTCQ